MQSVATAIGTPARRSASTGGTAGSREHVGRAGQQHRHRAGRSQRRDAGGRRVLEVVGRQRAVPGGQRGAAAVAELVGVQLHRQPERVAAANTRSICSALNAMRLAEPVDGVGEALRGDGRQHLVAHEGDVGVGVAVELRRDGVGAEERRHDVDRDPLREPAGDPEHPQLGVEVEPVAGLDLERRHPAGGQAGRPRRRRRRAARPRTPPASPATVERMPPPAAAISS